MTILILLWEAERESRKSPFLAKPLIQFASRLLSITDAIIVVVEVVIHDVVIFVRSLFYVPPHLAPTTTHNWVAYAPFICLIRPFPADVNCVIILSIWGTTLWLKYIFLFKVSDNKETEENLFTLMKCILTD